MIRPSVNAVYDGVSQADNSEIQNALFLKQKTSDNCKLATKKNTNFLGQLPPCVDKNSEDLVILILEFDGVTQHTIRQMKTATNMECCRNQNKQNLKQVLLFLLFCLSLATHHATLSDSKLIYRFSQA